jgi:dTDP-4-dehydrorhamnose 3,5-epimerase
MQVHETELPGVLLVETPVFPDQRGRFRELWREDAYAAAAIGPGFVQDNVSVSTAGVLRGLHFQHPHGQGKLVSAVRGTIFDVAVDVRRGSPTFGAWTGRELSGENGLQLWIPPGFAHGFSVLDREAVVVYRCTRVYRREYDRTVLWSDPDLGIRWPLSEPVLSDKDAAAPRLAELPSEALPDYAAAL